MFTTVQGYIDLSDGGTGKQEIVYLLQQDAVGAQIDLISVMMTDFQEVVYLRMKQGLTQNMQGDEFGESFDFHKNIFKFSNRHEGLGPIARMAETAGEVTAIGHFDIDFFESIHISQARIAGLKGPSESGGGLKDTESIMENCGHCSSSFTVSGSLAQEKRLVNWSFWAILPEKIPFGIQRWKDDYS